MDGTARAAAQPARADRAAQLVLDLRAERARRVPGDREQELVRPAGLVRVPNANWSTRRPLDWICSRYQCVGTILSMTAFTSTPGALRLFACSILARLPLAMLSIGWLVHVEHLTGSFATAGAVAGTLAVAQGVGGPLLGRLADRRGQTAVLVRLGAGRRRRARRRRRHPGRRAAGRAARRRRAARRLDPAGRRLHAHPAPDRHLRPRRPAPRLHDRRRRRRADVGLRPAARAARRRRLDAPARRSPPPGRCSPSPRSPSPPSPPRAPGAPSPAPPAPPAARCAARGCARSWSSWRAPACSSAASRSPSPPPPRRCTRPRRPAGCSASGAWAR